MKRSKLILVCMIVMVLLIAFIGVNKSINSENNSRGWHVVSLGGRNLLIHEKFLDRDSGKEFDIYIDNKHKNNMLCNVGIPWGASVRIRLERSNSMIIYKNNAIEINHIKNGKNVNCVSGVAIQVEQEPGNKYSREYLEWAKNTFELSAVD